MRKGLDLSKNEVDDVTRSATTQEAMASSSAVTSHNDADKSIKLRRCCYNDHLSFSSNSCRRRLANCHGHVVSLRPCGDEGGGSDVTAVSIPTPHGRASSSVADCRTFPAGLPLRTEPYPPSFIQSPVVYPSATQGSPPTIRTAAAATAFQRRLLLEALRTPSTHGYVDGNSAVSDLAATPTAAAAAVYGTQLAIHAWFRRALDTHTQLRLTADSTYLPHGGHSWGTPATSPPPLIPREMGRSSPSLDRSADNVDDGASASPIDASRPASELSHVEQTASGSDDDEEQLNQ